MAKYRVRDEQVPDEGAELECPECATHFLAQRPDGKELSVVVEKLKETRDKLLLSVEQHKRDAEMARTELDAARAHNEAHRAAAETTRVQLEALRAEALRELRTRDDEIGRLRAELDVGSAECARLIQMQSEADREVQRLRAELLKASTAVAAEKAVPLSAAPEVMSLIAALPPMLWGLERAVEYLEPFAKTETMLDAHVRQLSLLRGLMKKLIELSPSSGAQ
jgi:chromosome segregation ATPase